MPRRNHLRAKIPPRVLKAPASRPLTSEAMARNLVRRGLASPLILHGDPRRQHAPTQEEEAR